MRKHGGPPSRRDKHVTLAAISPPGVARGRFVGGQKSGLAGCKPPPLFTRGASSCSSQGRRQGEPWGASPRPSAPTYLPHHQRAPHRGHNTPKQPRPTDAIPHTTGPTQRRADTPKHHTTTPPWLRHSSPAHPAPGDPRPHATPTPHRPRTETRQEDDQETTRGCPTPPEDKPRATAHPTRPGHGAPPPQREGHHTAQHHHTAPHPPPPPGGTGHHSPPTQERSRAPPIPHPTPPAPPLETPHTSRQLNTHHRPQPEPHTGATPPARTATSVQPHTTTTPNGAPPPAHDPAPAAARAPNTSIARPPCHEAAPQHVNTHDDPMALDIDSLLELELQHTEDAEHHMDLTPPELEPTASSPADPNPQNAPPRPPPHERAPWTHLSNALRRHHPTHEASNGPAEYRASLEHDLPDVTGPGLQGYITPPPPLQAPPHKNGRTSTPSTSPT